MFADRERSFTAARKAVDAHNAARFKNIAGPKLAEAEAASLAARRAAHNTHVLFEENSQLFEHKRVADTKRWLQHLIMSELAFHCAAIESLSAALSAVGQVDPDAAMDALRDDLVPPTVTAADYSSAASGAVPPFTGMVVPQDIQAVAVYTGMPPATPGIMDASAAAAAGGRTPTPTASPAGSAAPLPSKSFSLPLTSPSPRPQPPMPTPLPPAIAISTHASPSAGAGSGEAMSGYSTFASASGGSEGGAGIAHAGRAGVSVPAPRSVAVPPVGMSPGAMQALGTLPSPWATAASGIVGGPSPSPPTATVGGTTAVGVNIAAAPPPAPITAPTPSQPKPGIFSGFGFGRKSPQPAPAGSSGASPTSAPTPSTSYSAMFGGRS